VSPAANRCLPAHESGATRGLLRVVPTRVRGVLATALVTTTKAPRCGAFGEGKLAASGTHGVVPRSGALASSLETLGTAIDAFLARADLAASSRRSYAQTLNRLGAELGTERLLGNVDAGSWTPRWSARGAGARRRRGIVMSQRRGPSSCSAGARGWLPGDLATLAERRREPADRTRAIPYVQIERLWRREDVAVREKALWRLLYETAARASEVLSLNVEDVDLENRRAIVCSKGGDIELLHFQTGSARLLPRLIAGRASGPLFLTYRRPAPGRVAAIVDVCPVTGRARLSYRRAEEIFCETSHRPAHVAPPFERASFGVVVPPRSP
jgi:integrase